MARIKLTLEKTEKYVELIDELQGKVNEVFDETKEYDEVMDMTDMEVVLTSIQSMLMLYDEIEDTALGLLDELKKGTEEGKIRFNGTFSTLMLVWMQIELDRITTGSRKMSDSDPFSVATRAMKVALKKASKSI